MHIVIMPRKKYVLLLRDIKLIFSVLYVFHLQQLMILTMTLTLLVSDTADASRALDLDVDMTLKERQSDYTPCSGSGSACTMSNRYDVIIQLFFSI